MGSADDEQVGRTSTVVAGRCISIMYVSSGGGLIVSSGEGLSVSSGGGLSVSSRGGLSVSSRGGLSVSSRGGLSVSSRGGLSVSSRGGGHWPNGRLYLAVPNVLLGNTFSVILRRTFVN